MYTVVPSTNWRDDHRKNGVNNIDMASVRAPWQNDPYKKPTHRTTQKHVDHENAIHITKFKESMYVRKRN